MRSNDFSHKRVAFVGYFASTSLKIKHFQELFESAISNLCILDKHLVCILCEFNFRNGHFPKYSRGLIFAKDPKISRNCEILSTPKFILVR